MYPFVLFTIRGLSIYSFSNVYIFGSSVIFALIGSIPILKSDLLEYIIPLLTEIAVSLLACTSGVTKMTLQKPSFLGFPVRLYSLLLAKV